MIVVFIIIPLVIAFMAVRLSGRPVTRECAGGCGTIVTWYSGLDARLNGWRCSTCRGETDPHQFPGYDWNEEGPDRYPSKGVSKLPG
jgi:hypothetical protein